MSHKKKEKVIEKIEEETKDEGRVVNTDVIIDRGSYYFFKPNNEYENKNYEAGRTSPDRTKAGH